MFQWDRNTLRLALPAERVLRLHRSLGDVQVALPGLPAQQAEAYVCVYAATQGARVAVVFHLRESRRLAFYRDDLESGSPLGVEEQRLAGLRFAESLGFLFDDSEIHLLTGPERQQLWKSLPLYVGGPVEGAASPATARIDGGGTRAGNGRERALAALGRLLATL